MRPCALCSRLVFLAVLAAACGGGGGGGGAPPLPTNHPPVLTVPAGLVGSGASYTATVPYAATTAFVFTAADPDGDTLQWQLTATGAATGAAGLSFLTPSSGSTFTLTLDPTSNPAAVSVQVLVEDPRGMAAAIDVLIVRSGAPTLTAVTPNNAFRSHAQRVSLTGAALSLGGTLSPSVQIGGFPGTSVQVVSDSTVTCDTPVGVPAGPSAVAVSTVFGTSQLAPSAFTMFAYPPSLGANDVQLDSGVGVDALAFARDEDLVDAVWLENGVVQQRGSSDRGLTWSAEQPLSGAEVATSPQVAVAGLRTAALWIGDGNALYIRISDDGSATFAPAVLLNAPAGGVPLQSPQLALTGDFVYATWLRGDAQVGTARVQATSSQDGGSTWTSVATIDDSANQRELQLVCRDDSAWLACIDERLGPSLGGVYTARTTDGGVTWSTLTRRSPTTTAVASPRLAFAAARGVLVWVRSGELEYVASPDSGATWAGTATQLRGTDQGAITEPALCTEGERLFTAYVAGGNSVWVTRVGGLGAQPQHVQVSASSDPPGETQIASRGNYVFAAWRSGTVIATTARIKQTVSVDLGLTFVAPTGFGDGTAAQEQGRLLIDGALVLFAWLDHRGSAVGLFTNRTAQ